MAHLTAPAALPNAERHPFVLAYVAAALMTSSGFLAHHQDLTPEELCVQAADTATDYVNNEYEDGATITFDYQHLLNWMQENF